jgi:hypothetical protein
VAWTLLDSGVAGFADGGSGHTYTFPAGAAAAGNLLVLAVSSDTVVFTPPGWSAAASDVHNIGAYLFYTVATGGETSVVVTTSGNFATEVGFARYSGNTASTPLDVTAVGFNTVSSNTTPAATATLTGTGELVVAAACLGGMGGGTPNTPVWSSGYTNRLNGQTAGTGTTDQHLFVGDRYNGSGSESPNCSWTSNANNQTLLVAAFKPAGGQTITLGQAVEVDTSQPVTPAKTRTLGQAVEADTARPVVVAKTRSLGQATETGTARPIAVTKTLHLRQAAETDIAAAVTPAKTRLTGIATGTGTALRMVAAKHRTIGQASESDTAHPVTVTGGAAPPGDVTVTAGKPARGWSAGQPARAWSIGEPARAWSAGAPHT